MEKGKKTQPAVTSIRISPGLWKEARKYCIDKDITISEFVENLLKDKLRKS